VSRAKWHGSTVRRWRRYWAPRIASAEQAGHPLVCPFWSVDPQCPGTIRSTDTWDVDHGVQLVDGGDIGLGNQAPAHTSCNRRAGQRTAIWQRTQTRTRVRRWL
jgi:hypothetical protein